MTSYMKKYIDSARALLDAQKRRTEQKNKLCLMYTGRLLSSELEKLDKDVYAARADCAAAAGELKKAAARMVDAASPRLFIGDCREALEILRYDLVKVSGSELLAMARANSGNMVFLRAAHEYAKKNGDRSSELELLRMQDALFVDKRAAQDVLNGINIITERAESIDDFVHSGLIGKCDEVLSKLQKEYSSIEYAEAMKANEAELEKEKKLLEEAEKILEQKKQDLQGSEEQFKKQQKEHQEAEAAVEKQRERVKEVE